jgi:hypothetical protein
LKTVDSISACGVQVVALNQVLNMEFQNASLLINKPLKIILARYEQSNNVENDALETVIECLVPITTLSYLRVQFTLFSVILTQD